MEPWHSPGLPKHLSDSLGRRFCPWFLENKDDSEDIEVIENGVSWLHLGDLLPALDMKGIT